MRDYDQLRLERDLDFKLGGEAFRIHMLPMKAVKVWVDREDAVGDTTGEFMQMCVDRIADAVADGNGAEERWRALCDADNGPSYGELRELARWVWEAQTDFPTTPPEPSQAGQPRTASSSKAG